MILIFTCLLIAVSGFSQAPWSLNGNTGTIASTNFLGTTDNAPIDFKVNNQWAGFTGYPDKNNVSFGYLSLTNPLGKGSANTAIGAQALQWGNSNNCNVAIGAWALEWCTEGDNNVALGTGTMGNSMKVGSHNVAIGQRALFNNKQSENTAVGSESLFSNTEGLGLTGVGFRTLCNNTTGEFNTAIGFQALLLNTTGYWNVALGSGALQWNLTGRFNTAGGNSSLHFNRTGIENTAFGEQALGGNLDGSYNTAVGCRSLWSVTTGPNGDDTGYGHGEANTAVGYESLREITTGKWNTGIGLRALQKNSLGHDNTAIGCYALSSNTIGGFNIAIGNQAMSRNTDGYENIAIGRFALMNNIEGNHNIAIGYGADVVKDGLFNSVAIGYNAKVTTDNQVVIGNSNTTSIGGFVPWSNFSDGRANKNIRNNVPGLVFINKLRPITYNLDINEAESYFHSGKEIETPADSLSLTPQINKLAKTIQLSRSLDGFIAQEVEKTAREIGYEFSGIDVDGKGMYALQYSTFVVPLVKAVQELSEQSNSKDAAIASLRNQVEELNALVNRILEKGNFLSLGNENGYMPSASLEQNFPNPFNQTTTIRYRLPETYRSAMITIANISGNKVKQIPISNTGSNSLMIEAGSLPVGMYVYSLYVDNIPIDTKKMILTN